MVVAAAGIHDRVFAYGVWDAFSSFLRLLGLEKACICSLDVVTPSDAGRVRCRCLQFCIDHIFDFVQTTTF